MIVAAVVLAGALIKLTSVLTEGSSPQGPDSSSFSPTSDGLAALSQLLTRSGDHVVQLTSSLGQAELPVGSTVIVAAPTSWQPADSTALARDLVSGGRVIVAGQPPSGLLPAILGASPGPEWSSNQLTSSTPVDSDPLVYGVTQVNSAGPGVVVDQRGHDSSARIRWDLPSCVRSRRRRHGRPAFHPVAAPEPPPGCRRQRSVRDRHSRAGRHTRCLRRVRPRVRALRKRDWRAAEVVEGRFAPCATSRPRLDALRIAQIRPSGEGRT